MCMHRDPHVLDIKLSVSTWRAGGEGVCMGKPRAHVQVIGGGDPVQGEQRQRRGAAAGGGRAHAVTAETSC